MPLDPCFLQLFYKIKCKRWCFQVAQINMKSPSAFSSSLNFCGINLSRWSQAESPGLGWIGYEGLEKETEKITDMVYYPFGSRHLCYISMKLSCYLGTKSVPRIPPGHPSTISLNHWVRARWIHSITLPPLNSDPPIPVCCGRNWNSSDFSEAFKKYSLHSTKDTWCCTCSSAYLSCNERLLGLLLLLRNREAVRSFFPLRRQWEEWPSSRDPRDGSVWKEDQQLAHLTFFKGHSIPVCNAYL